MLNDSDLSSLLRAAAARAGLEWLGVVPLVRETEAFPRFETWLAQGQHAGMRFLENHKPLRQDPRTLLVGARSAIVLGFNYFLGDKTPSRSLVDAAAPRIAQYARWRDYHRTLRRRAESVLAELLAQAPGEVGRVVVDSAPMLERALAARTGRGFIGKNTCFIDPARGSFVLLVEILTSAALVDIVEEPLPEAVDPTRRSVQGGCGSCRRCQIHCPTGALDQDYRLDANLCLAYWTIEHRGTIPERFWPWLRLYWFGCDICQLVCPYNRKAAPQSGAVEVERRLTELPELFEVATMTESDYERLFGGTPLTRAKREGLMRNALIAMTVTANARLDEALARAAALAPAPVVMQTIEQVGRWRAAAAVPKDQSLKS
jgi:epoxyqueuosine reductase